MNLVELQRKLLAAARGHAPSEQVPYAFEQRIMARLRSQSVADGWVLWGRALWRATAPCIAVMLLLGAWTLFRPVAPPSTGDLSQDLENTLLAAVYQDQPSDSAR
jgi:hypothetical protein